MSARSRHARRLRGGFTLIELLIATALMVIVILWLMQTFTVQHRTYTVVEHVSEAQQNSRAIAALMEAEIRVAGFMVAEGGAVCAVDNTGAPDVLYVSAADILDPSGINEPDVAVDFSGAATGFIVGQGGTTTITLDDSAIPDGDGTFFDTDANGTNDSDFAPGMGVIVTDAADASRGAACGRIISLTTLAVPGSNLGMQVAWESLMATATGGTDYRVIPAHRYDINGTNLRRNGTVLAPEVEDMQVSYFFDLNSDGVMATDGSETPGSADVGAAVYTSRNWQGQDLREVRLSFVVRSRGQDPNTNYTGGAFEPTENRVAPAGTDRFRRRVHRAVVRTRNVGFRDL